MDGWLEVAEYCFYFTFNVLPKNSNPRPSPPFFVIKFSIWEINNIHSTAFLQFRLKHNTLESCDLAFWCFVCSDSAGVYHFTWTIATLVYDVLTAQQTGQNIPFWLLHTAKIWWYCHTWVGLQSMHGWTKREVFHFW